MRTIEKDSIDSRYLLTLGEKKATTTNNNNSNITGPLEKDDPHTRRSLFIFSKLRNRTINTGLTLMVLLM